MLDSSPERSQGDRLGARARKGPRHAHPTPHWIEVRCVVGDKHGWTEFKEFRGANATGFAAVFALMKHGHQLEVPDVLCATHTTTCDEPLLSPRVASRPALATSLLPEGGAVGGIFL